MAAIKADPTVMRWIGQGLTRTRDETAAAIARWRWKSGGAWSGRP